MLQHLSLENENRCVAVWVVVDALHFQARPRLRLYLPILPSCSLDLANIIFDKPSIIMTHDLFTIPELCICIAEAVPDYSEHYLWNLDPKGPHLPTLASLAQVARVFKEPALSVLWRRLRNVIPVACLFPESVIAYNEEAKLFDLVEDVEVLKYYYFIFIC